MHRNMGNLTKYTLEGAEARCHFLGRTDKSCMDLMDVVEAVDPVSGQKYTRLRQARALDEQSLKEYLHSVDFKMRVAIIHQAHSWAPLQISEPMLGVFTNWTNAMEDVCHLVDSFRLQRSEVDEAFSVCAWKPQPALHELAYLLSYPEMKGFDDAFHWVIRKCGLYHQYQLKTKRSTCLFIAPNPQTSWAEKIVHAANLEAHPLRLHTILFDKSLQNWRWYISNLDHEHHKLASEIMSFEIEKDLDFVNMYDKLSGLRFVETRLSPAVPILAAHAQVLDKLRQWNRELEAHGEIEPGLASAFVVALDNLASRVEALERNAKFLLSRIVAPIQMASDTISLKSQKTAEDMSSRMLLDSVSVRMISIVTLVYLPASFVTSFFGMGFFSIDHDDKSGARWTAHSIWVYFAVAVPLSALTLAYWKQKCRLGDFYKKERVTAPCV
ncbi:hypothetical protein B0I35DRAFT_442603 [Stachybotrys elegans]|uniref:CorA-like transporter domain-containing protein n=1 Tax=Stachybotrys elegans TaxID=80388 RepID=A0A8K0WLY0_9HYPO|nr:hypothetical protein B0I35DRAFT_442603 [Stachybotrys elegans]